MNKTVFITDIAKTDIKNLIEYIAKDNKTVSLKLIDDFYKSFELLSSFPEAGYLKKDIKDKTVRIYTIRKSFTIIYRIFKDRVEILRILTKYQNLLALLD